MFFQVNLSTAGNAAPRRRKALDVALVNPVLNPIKPVNTAVFVDPEEVVSFRSRAPRKRDFGKQVYASIFSSFICGPIQKQRLKKK